MKFILNKIDELNHELLINKDEFKFIISFLFYTGLRANEFTVLKISDFKKKTIAVIPLHFVNIDKQFKDRTMNLIETKTNNHRKVYLVNEILEITRKFIEQKKYTKDDYLLDFKKTEKVISRKQIGEAITNYIKILKKKKKFLMISFQNLLLTVFVILMRCILNKKELVQMLPLQTEDIQRKCL